MTPDTQQRAGVSAGLSQQFIQPSGGGTIAETVAMYIGVLGIMASIHHSPAGIQTAVKLDLRFSQPTTVY